MRDSSHTDKSERLVGAAHARRLSLEGISFLRRSPLYAFGEVMLEIFHPPLRNHEKIEFLKKFTSQKVKIKD